MVNRTWLIGLATVLVLLLFVLVGWQHSRMTELDNRVVDLEKEAIWLHFCATMNTNNRVDARTGWINCELESRINNIMKETDSSGEYILYEWNAPFRWNGKVARNYYDMSILQK